MEKLIKSITLNENIEFRGNYLELKSLLENSNKKFYMEWSSRKDILIKSKWSIGTFGGLFSGIYGYIQIENTHARPLKLKLKTKVKLELIFMSIISIIMFITALLSAENVPILFFIFLPLSIFSVWYIYRIQEKVLFSNFKKLISK